MKKEEDDDYDAGDLFECKHQQCSPSATAKVHQRRILKEEVDGSAEAGCKIETWKSTESVQCYWFQDALRFVRFPSNRQYVVCISLCLSICQQMLIVTVEGSLWFKGNVKQVVWWLKHVSCTLFVFSYLEIVIVCRTTNWLVGYSGTYRM